MMFPEAMMHEQVWFDRPKYEEERENYQLFLSNNLTLQVSKPHEEIFTKETKEVAKESSSAVNTFTSNEVSSLKQENEQLKKMVEDLVSEVKKLSVRVERLEGGGGASTSKDTKPTKKVESDDDESDVDLFGSDDDEDEEETEAEKQKKQALVAAYNEKKAKKTAVIPKSSILLDVKPWDDETDMVEMERLVRTIVLDGLVWGAQAKLVPLAYGIRKLQIPCVVEDDKVGTDILEEEITKFEDIVQSVDVAAFNKI